MNVKRLLGVILAAIMILTCSVSTYADVGYGLKSYSYALNGATMWYTLNIQASTCTATTSLNRTGNGAGVSVFVTGTFDQILSDDTRISDTTSNAGYGVSGATASISCPYNGYWTSVSSSHYAQYDGAHTTKTI